MAVEIHITSPQLFAKCILSLTRNSHFRYDTLIYLYNKLTKMSSDIISDAFIHLDEFINNWDECSIPDALILFNLTDSQQLYNFEQVYILPNKRVIYRKSPDPKMCDVWFVRDT